MNEQQTLPSYLKYSQILIGLVAAFYVLYVAQEIIIPIIYSIIIAILINPIVNYLSSKKINRIMAIFIALIFSITLVFGLLYFIGSQASLFSDAFPQLKIKFNFLILDFINWISDYFNISEFKINKWLNNLEAEGLKSSTFFLGQTISTISGVLIYVFLVPVYVFMILYYKPLLLTFINLLVSKDKYSTVFEVLQETKSLIQNYLLGLLIEMVLVASLNSISLMIIGLDYAILIGVIGAILNIIPYLGGIVAIALPMILALATKSPTAALYVLIAYLIVQFVDNNIIVPKVVASKVKVNGLVSMVVVIIGGALWGFSGMFLSIPIIAILKAVFDKIDKYKAFGFLLGDTMPDI